MLSPRFSRNNFLSLSPIKYRKREQGKIREEKQLSRKDDFYHLFMILSLYGPHLCASLWSFARITIDTHFPSSAFFGFARECCNRSSLAATLLLRRESSSSRNVKISRHEGAMRINNLPSRGPPSSSPNGPGNYALERGRINCFD